MAAEAPGEDEASAALALDEAAAPEDALVDLARAKVNLFLHVRGRRPDGRHELESLAVFPQFGDLLAAEAAPLRSLTVDGPFGDQLEEADGNLVARAVEAYAEAAGEERGVALRLVKRLPVASGVGGGSADAAATLRLLARLWGRALADETLAQVALSLGADVPVCLGSAPSLMSGIGERLSPAPAFPAFWLVLANPLRPLSTAAVFGSLERRENPAVEPLPPTFSNLDALVGWLARQRNDLEAPARGLAPAVDALLDALRMGSGCRLARMSGSGATCFGIFAEEREALAVAERLRRSEPGWWSAAARVAAWSPPEAPGAATDRL